MLTVEEIKRCIEEFKPESFELDLQGVKINELSIVCVSSTHETCREGFSFDVITNKPLSSNRFIYDLFLQRVIEGINEDVRFKVKQEDNILDVYLCDDFADITSITQIGGDTPDQAKEQAIRYILGQL